MCGSSAISARPNRAEAMRRAIIDLAHRDQIHFCAAGVPFLQAKVCGQQQVDSIGFLRKRGSGGPQSRAPGPRVYTEPRFMHRRLSLPGKSGPFRPSPARACRNATRCIRIRAPASSGRGVSRGAALRRLAPRSPRPAQPSSRPVPTSRTPAERSPHARTPCGARRAARRRADLPILPPQVAYCRLKCSLAALITSVNYLSEVNIGL